MSFRDWASKLFPFLNPKDREESTISLFGEFGSLGTEVFIKYLAIEAAINLIANAIAQAKFRTFERGKETKGEDYYLFNVEPNPNKSAAEFWKHVIHDLVYKNECLVFMQEGQLIRADSWNRHTYAFKENLYSQVTIENHVLKEILSEREVFFFVLNSENIRNLIDGLYSDYVKLLAYSKNTYKRSNAQRGVLNIPTSYPQSPQALEGLQDLMSAKMKRFFEAETGAVLPLQYGLSYTDLTNHTYKNSSDSRDIRYLIDDIFDFTAMACQISPQLLKGSVADSSNSWDHSLTSGINPIAKILEDEINRKYYGKKAFLNCSYLHVDTSMIKVINIKDKAMAVDILTRNGVNTLDDNLQLLDREPIGGILGQQRFVTKNLEKM